jgi:hypothetical protein
MSDTCTSCFHPEHEPGMCMESPVKIGSQRMGICGCGRRGKKKKPRPITPAPLSPETVRTR